MFVACVCSCINTCIGIYGRSWEESIPACDFRSFAFLLLSDVVQHSFVLWVGAHGQGLGGTRPLCLVCLASLRCCLASLGSCSARVAPLFRSGGVRSWGECATRILRQPESHPKSSNLLPIFLTQVSPIFCTRSLPIAKTVLHRAVED